MKQENKVTQEEIDKAVEAKNIMDCPKCGTTADGYNDVVAEEDKWTSYGEFTVEHWTSVIKCRDCGTIFFFEDSTP